MRGVIGPILCFYFLTRQVKPAFPPKPARFHMGEVTIERLPGGEAIDTVVLACTHFPLLVDELSAAFGPGVRFVDGAAGIARRIAALTSGQPFARTKPDLALFTRAEVGLDLTRPALQRYGLERLEVLA